MTSPRLFPPFASPCGCVSTPCSFMAAPGGKRMGSVRGRVGVSDPVVSGPSSSVSGALVPPFPVVSSGGCSAGRRGPGFVSQRSGGGTPSTGVSRFLWPDFRGPQGHGGLASGSRPVATQSLRLQDSFQNGDRVVSPFCHPAERLGHVSRPQGCLFSRSYASQVPALASFHVGQPDFSVSSAPFRPVPQSVGFYPGHAVTSHRSAAARHPSADVPGRLARSRSVARNLPRSYSRGPSDGRVSGVHPQPREVRPLPCPVFSLPGHAHRHPVDDCTAGRQASPASVSVTHSATFSAARVSASAVISPRLDGESVCPRTVGPPSQTPASARLSPPLVPDARELGRSDTSRRLVSPSHGPLARSSLADVGSPAGTSDAAAPAFHRCLQRRLGSSRRRSFGSGRLVPGSVPSPCKYSGDGSGAPRSLCVPIVSAAEISSAVHRQHHGSLLSQQAGGGRAP